VNADAVEFILAEKWNTAPADAGMIQMAVLPLKVNFAKQKG